MFSEVQGQHISYICRTSENRINFPYTPATRTTNVFKVQSEHISYIFGSSENQNNFPSPSLLTYFRSSSHYGTSKINIEFLRAVTKVLPPRKDEKNPTAAWTPEGERCKASKEHAHWEPGVRYEAVEGPDRILLPDLPVLETLRHRWYWQKRRRPYAPVWNYAKVPRVSLPPEETTPH